MDENAARLRWLNANDVSSNEGQAYMKGKKDSSHLFSLDSDMNNYQE